MDSEILKLFKQVLFGHDHNEINDEMVANEWQQVGMLTKEEMLAKRNLYNEMAMTRSELELLKKKCSALCAAMDVKKDEFWAAIYKSHSLTDANYHLHDDGRIFRQPKK